MFLQTATARLEDARRRRAAPSVTYGITNAEGGLRVLLVDPEVSVRRALADLLRLRLDDPAICEVGEPASALAAVAEWCPTVGVADAHGGVDLRVVQRFIADVHEVDPVLPVVVVSVAFTAGMLPADGEFGAFRSLPKGNVEGLLASIREGHEDYQAARRR